MGAMKELVERFALYGAIEQYYALDEYPAEEFTEVYLIKFLNLQIMFWRVHKTNSNNGNIIISEEFPLSIH